MHNIERSETVADNEEFVRAESEPVAFLNERLLTGRVDDGIRSE